MTPKIIPLKFIGKHAMLKAAGEEEVIPLAGRRLSHWQGVVMHPRRGESSQQIRESSLAPQACFKTPSAVGTRYHLTTARQDELSRLSLGRLGAAKDYTSRLH